MTNTSREAYLNIEFSGKAETQRHIILNYLREKKKATRREIARDLNMETSTVSARVNSLRDDFNLIHDTNTIKCPISKKTVHLVECAW